MNEAFERYRFPNSSPKKIFIARNTDEENGQPMGFQLKLELGEENARMQLEGKDV